MKNLEEIKELAEKDPRIGGSITKSDGTIIKLTGKDIIVSTKK